jgi:uncharacterized lipoprotein YddW (UPF0748 family)
MRQTITLLLCCLFMGGLFAQKREMRGAWIATVNNIDFPSRKGLTSSQQQAEFINIVNTLQRAGINAVFVQIRSVGDAMYPSEIEPWSEVITGRQGQPPLPYYDPLAFMIEACRKRGIEFHAWFNPYRVVSDVRTARLDSSKHVAARRPEWLLAFGNLRILDPGIPDVRNYIARVVMDVLRRYDVDGIHFDDYFYPYPVTGVSFNDDATYQRFPRGITNRNDWRRDNVNLLIRQLNDSIRSVKPWVKFGISPFGIWQNVSTSQPLGSDTRGLQGFNDIFADSRRWAEMGWVDYLMPQVYWSIGFAVADYGKLIPWWNNNIFGRHLYIGQAAYRVGTSSSTDANFLRPIEIPNQIRFHRTFANVRGSVFYNTTSLRNNPLGVLDSLRQNLFIKPVLLPQMAWKDQTVPPAPRNATIRSAPDGVIVEWLQPAASDNPLARPRQYAIYRFEEGATFDLSNVQALIGVTANDTTAFIDTAPNRPENPVYLVTALNRLHNESPPSNPARPGGVVSTKEERPLRQWMTASPNPFSEQTTITYALNRKTAVRLIIADLNGREIANPVPKQEQTAGVHTVRFEMPNVPSGIYFGILQMPGSVLTCKFLFRG